MSNSNEQERLRNARAQNWPDSQDEPTLEGVNILLAFTGLMGFAYNEDTGLCEVGVNSKADDHKFEINVFEQARLLESDMELVYSFTPDSHDEAGGVINVNVDRPETQGVKFYLPDFPNVLDWSHLVDFEGADFYGDVLKKKRKVQKPKITVNNGLFFILPTHDDFVRITKDATGSAYSLGKIAFMALATASQDPEREGYIYLDSGVGRVRLSRPRHKSLLCFFTNVCPTDECDPDELDFQMYYKMFKTPENNSRRFLLQKTRGSEPVKNMDFSALSAFFNNRNFPDFVSSQDSPCGPAGFGRSGGGSEMPPG